MNRILELSVLISCFLFIGLISLNSSLLILIFPLLAYLLVGMFYQPQKIDLKVNRTITPERVTVNSPVTVKLFITNNGSHLEEVVLEDKVPVDLVRLDGESSAITQLESNSTIEISYSVSGKRGIYHFHGLQAKAYERTGLSLHQELVKTQGSLFILPEFLRLKNVAIRPRKTRVYSGSIPSNQGGSGIEFHSIREYQPGDPVHLINWRASARHRDTLFSNQFQQERLADVWLIVDARKRSEIICRKGSLFEYSIIASAALAQALLNQGNRLGLLIYGGFLDWTFPGYGKLQYERILRALARARPGDSMVFEKLANLPTRMFPMNSQLVVISPLYHEDLPILGSLRARGYQVLGISPDPIAFERGDLDDLTGDVGYRIAQIERSLLLTQLRQAGVYTFNWDVTVPFDRAMALPLSRLLPWLNLWGVRS